MVAHPEPATMTVEEYLALEQTSQVKHEYSHGHVYAMSGGTVAHDRIANNVRTALDNHIGDGPQDKQGRCTGVSSSTHKSCMACQYSPGRAFPCS
jgi:Uma2 family endonuclease